MEATDREPTTTIHVAHIGNSIQFFNDGPNLLQRMLQQKYPSSSSSSSSSIIQNSCLRGGATLSSLLETGNGRHFTTAATATDPDCRSIGSPTVPDLLTERSWDFVIMNDHTQSPSRTHSKEETLQVLQDQYLPLLLQQQQIQDTTCLSPSNTTKSTMSKSEKIPTKSLSSLSSSSSPKIIFLQTAAYRFPGTNNSTDLGTFDQFTEGTYQGYLEYTNVFPPTMAVVAPVGRAYQFLKNNTTAIITNTTSNDQRRRRRDDDTNPGDVILHQDDDDDENISSSSSSSSSSFLLWEKLYAHDDFHPSLYGTLLLTNVLYCTIINEPPPVYDSAWWTTARFMQPPSTSGGEQPPYPLPTKNEADILRRVACFVCNISIDA